MDSFTNKPILTDGTLLYWSNIIVCLPTCTKFPRTKYTPLLIVAADAIKLALVEIVFAKVFPA